MTTFKLVLVRHGESEWNKENKFCGWYDADLSETGIHEAITAGKTLKEKGYGFDIAFTSVLKRAVKTLYHIQDQTDTHWIPVVRHWRLNERMYGALQGLNKSETAAKHGEDQVKIWRRSFNTPPPAVEEKSEHNPANDLKYKFVDKHLIPKCESLELTIQRVLPYWYDAIVPAILKGERVLIAAHGNSLRALVKYFDKVSDDDIVGLNIPTGIPLVYELDHELNPIKHYYLADEATVNAATAKVANQGKAK